MKIYIGCSLTYAPEEFKESIELVKNDLRSDFEVMDFIGTVAGTSQDVYRWDIHECVEKCDAFIAICDLPSIGLGYELGTAVERLKKPTLALAHKDSKITRLVLGIEQPNFKFERYDSTDEIGKRIRSFLTELLK